MDKNKLTALMRSFNHVANIVKEENIEYWCARDLMNLMGYDRWENFEKAIIRAMESCKTSGISVYLNPWSCKTVIDCTDSRGAKIQSRPDFRPFQKQENGRVYKF